MGVLATFLILGFYREVAGWVWGKVEVKETFSNDMTLSMDRMVQDTPVPLPDRRCQFAVCIPHATIETIL